MFQGITVLEVEKSVHFVLSDLQQFTDDNVVPIV